MKKNEWGVPGATGGISGRSGFVMQVVMEVVMEVVMKLMWSMENFGG